MDPKGMYSFHLDFVVWDNYLWKCMNRDWVPGGHSELQMPSGVYIHPDTLNSGA